MNRLFLGAALCGVIACQPAFQTDEEDVETANGNKSAETLMQEIKAGISAACTQTSDCLSAGAGHRACGGPETFLVLSKWDSIPKLFPLIHSYTQVRKSQVGEAGTCQMLVAPALNCVDNKCKSRSGSGESTELSELTGSLILTRSGVSDAARFTFRKDGDTTSYFVRTSELDAGSLAKLEKLRQPNNSVSVNVRLFARAVTANICEFTFSTCTKTVNAFEIRAVKIL